MPDENNTNTKNELDELVKELTKEPSASRQNPDPDKNPFPKPRFNSDSSPQSPDQTQGLKKMDMAGSESLPKKPSSPVSIKGYQSSIRTMSDDIGNVKKGKGLGGTQTQRRFEVPKPDLSKTVPGQIPPPPKFKTPKIELGKTEKSKPLPSLKDTKSISVPPSGKKSSNKMVFYGTILLILILFGVGYWFLMLRTTEPEVVFTPTPVLTPTPTPVITLDDIFKNIDKESIGLDSLDLVAVDGGEFKILDINSLGLISFLDELLINYPALLPNYLNDQSLILVYGQQELFNEQGTVDLNKDIEKRWILINEVTDFVNAKESLLNWELTIDSGFSDLFDLDLNSRSSEDYLDSSYRGVSIRYNNFPYADSSIDYSIASGFNRKSYLVITNSRESMFSVIDVLKGF